uniref:Uncharacterized protein n=1 Tax=candidate division WOR-3 bacterium TaxID=2052148 RepID=A0A7C4THF4_UNCW3
MNRNRIILLTMIGVVGIIIIFRLLPDEKKRLLKDINKLKEGVEKENLAIVLDYIDRDYLDRHYFDFKKLESTIEEFFNTADSIRIMMSGIRVWIDSTVENNFYAHCSLGLRVIAKYNNEKILVFGGVLQPASVKGYFRKEKNFYKIYSAEY